MSSDLNPNLTPSVVDRRVAPGGNARRGKFITLEGVDGAGKSTHIAWLADLLRGLGIELLQTREPGGTPLGEKLRALVLHDPMHIDTETLLMFAARREHMDKFILPALDAGRWVLSDRFTDATFAYQGGGRQMVRERIKALETWVQGDFQPDLTLIFDVSVEVAAQRRRGRTFQTRALQPGAFQTESAASAEDRFESEDRDFFNRVRAEYLRRAAEFPGRIKLIDATGSPDDIHKLLEKYIIDYCLK